MKLRRTSFVTLAFVLLFVMVFASGCDKRRLDCSAVITPVLDSMFTPLFEGEGPGAVIVVMRGDTVAYNRSFGYADLSTMEPITDTTLFNICSISKQFSAVALLKLQEDGKLKLSDSIKKFFPEFKADFYNKITLHHLLSHTSGIPDLRPRSRAEWKEYIRHNKSPFASVDDYKLFGLTRESTRYLINLDTLMFKPGTAYEYQNPTYQLVMPIVERVTGMDFSAYMDSAVLKPAGLVSTVYIDPVESQPQFSHAYRPLMPGSTLKSYRSSDGRWEEYDYGEVDFFPTKADGGLYSSAKELCIWEKALFSGKVLNDSSLKVAFTPVIGTETPSISYGLGFFLEQLPQGERKIFHTGDNGGYLTVEAYYPERDVFYVILANRPDWDREQIIKDMDELFTSLGWI